MKIWDLITCGGHNLWVRKTRTALNLVGIVISCLLLLSTMAAARGIQLAIQRFVENSSEALRFRILPSYDATIMPPEEATSIAEEMSEARRGRMQELLKRQWQRENLPRPRNLTFERLDDVSRLEHIVDVMPRLQFGCSLTLADETSSATLGGASYQDSELSSRVVLGEFLKPEEPEGLLLHEALAFDMGFRSDSALQSLIGKSVRVAFKQTRDPMQLLTSEFASLSISDQQALVSSLNTLLSGGSVSELNPRSLAVLRKIARSGSSANDSESAPLQKGETLEQVFQVVGVFRDREREDETTILSRFFGGSERMLIYHGRLRAIGQKLGNQGASSALVYVDNVLNLDDVTATLKERSIYSISATSTVQRLYQSIDRSRFSLLGVAGVILAVAAIGISNTMIISVVERSEEIGIMKAVGASNRQVTWIILFESMMTGALGGVLAILLTYLLSSLGNELLRSYVEERGNLDLDGSVIAVEPWMIVSTLLVAILVTALAGMWPALKAAKLDPVTAMGRL